MLTKFREKANFYCENKPLLVYFFTSLFLLLFMYCICLFDNKTLIRSADGIYQWYYNFCLLHDTIRDLFTGNGFSFWSWQVGLGSDTLSFLSTFLFNPFAWLCALFPKNNMETCFNLVILIELFAAGFTMCIFLKHRNVRGGLSVTGALAYIFSFYTLFAINQIIFLFSIVIFPIILMGIDYIFDGKTPILLMVSSALIALNFLYFTYMIVVVCIIYILLKTNIFSKRYNIQFAIKRLASVFFFTICAMLIIAPFLLPCLYSFFEISTSSSSNIQLFPAFSDIFSFLPSFVCTQESVENGNYAFLGILGVFSLLIPFFFKRAKHKCVDSIMFCILAIMAFLPFLRQFMNGFSYASSRFCFMLVFFTIASASHVLTEGRNVLKTGLGTTLVFASILFALELVIVLVFQNGSAVSALYLIINTLAGIICYIFILKINKFNLTCLSTSLACIVALLLIVYSPSGLNRVSEFLETGKALEYVNSSAFKNAPEKQKNEFYRSDTSAHAKLNKNDGYYSDNTNDAIYYNVPSVSIYSSMISSKWLEFNKTMSNNQGYHARVAPAGNDNRPGIDYLMCVKNFYLDEENRKPSSSYAGSYFENTDDENVMTSKYTPSIGYVFNSAISYDKFAKLDAVQKEQALLQTVVIDDENCDYPKNSEMNFNSSVAKTKIKLDDEEIISNKFEKNTTSTKNIKVEFENNYENYDIYLVVKNLHRKDYSKNKEYKIKNNSSPSNFKKINYKLIDTGEKAESFTINLTYGNVKKSFRKVDSGQALENMGTYVSYLGAYDGNDNEITFSLSQLGSYSWDEIEVVEVPNEALNNSMQRMQDSSINVTKVENDVIGGTLNASEDGILFLSVIKTPGWQVFIDGQEVDTITVDVAFTGCNISAGEHSVEMKYTPPFMKVGCYLSILGVLVLCVFPFLIRTKLSRTAFGNKKV